MLSPAPSRRSRRRPPAPLLSRLGLLALASVGAVVIYLLRPGAVTDDTYAFLDWGRDLRHGFLPLLERRTFQPLPIGAGAVLSLFGAAAPTITILLCLVALVLLAAAAWRVVLALDYGWPAAALAAVLALVTPLLPVLALVGYNNLPFATLMLWALVFDLEERPTGAWAMLILAGLTRPEAWLFLLAYGALCWWRAGRPLAPRRWLGIAALALGPMIAWAVLEWGLFGDPLYSLRNTTAPVVVSTHSNSPRALWGTLRVNVPTAVLIASAIGAIGLPFTAPRRRAATTLGATALAVASIVILASSNFNLPGRDYSLLVALVCTLAAVGTALPARLLVLRGGSPTAAAALVLAGAALVLGLSASRDIQWFRGNFRSLAVTHDTGRTFTRQVTLARAAIDVAGAPRHSVAMLGAVDNSELAWVLGVPYNAITDHIEPATRLVVQPSPATWSRLKHHHLTDRTPVALPRGWRVIYSGDWMVFAADPATPARLR